jgi:hypothetical protein
VNPPVHGPIGSSEEPTFAAQALRADTIGARRRDPSSLRYDETGTLPHLGMRAGTARATYFPMVPARTTYFSMVPARATSQSLSA